MYKFDSDQGFFITTAITEYDTNTEIIEQPEVYGELFFEHYGWDFEDERSANNIKSLITHQ